MQKQTGNDHQTDSFSDYCQDAQISEADKYLVHLTEHDSGLASWRVFLPRIFFRAFLAALLLIWQLPKQYAAEIGTTTVRLCGQDCAK